MSEITRRSATPVDDTFLRALYASTRQEELALVEWDDAAREQFLSMQFQAQLHHYRTHFPDAIHQLILYKQLPIGRIYVDYRADEARLLDISLLPEWRNRGIGRKLMEQLLAEVRASGKPLRLYVWQGNQGAFRFYQRLGFEPIASTDMYILMENKT